MSTRTDEQVAEEAKTLLRKGWTQGGQWTDVDETGNLCYCAGGAVAVALGVFLDDENEPDEDNPRWQTWARALDRVAKTRAADDRVEFVAEYNDTVAQSVDDVLTLVDDALASIRTDQ